MNRSPNIAVVVGNPKPASRTLAAAASLAQTLARGGPTSAIDIVTLGTDLLTFGSASVEAEISKICSSQIIIVASPTYKATYSGILKLFVDQLPPDGLRGSIGIPLMLGAAPHHALAPELHLKPLLAELGAATPTPGLYLSDKTYESDGKLDAFVERWRDAIFGSVEKGMQG
jgi:FMN reductase